MVVLNTQKKFLNVAKSIGFKICNDAIWYNNQCNWIGRFEKIDEGTSDMNYDKNLLTTVESLGPDLYHGTSGIAYFLSKLYALTRNEIFRKTAAGGINNAIYQFEKLHSQNFGFYSGKIGIIFLILQVGVTIKNQSFIDQAYDLLLKLTKTIPKNHLLDIISGNAGSIPALLSLYDFFKDQRILALSVRLGLDLISSSTKENVGISWGSQSNGITNAMHNLTGYSHGASGIGYSLLELYDKTDEKKFLHASTQAFAYEDYWFNPKYNNWPDFRVFDDGKSVDEQNDFNYSVGWCHGSPGIGLTRLRAYDLLKEEKYLRDSQAALSSSKNIISNKINNLSDYSLCHGIGGISEIFIYASDILRKKSLKNFVDKIGLQGIENYAKESSWSCGIRQGQPPGLMLGLSGIGYFYLRLYDSSTIPSILLVR